MKGLLLPLALAGVLEAYGRLKGFTSDCIAPPSEIATAWIGALRDGSLLKGTVETLLSALSGLLIGGAIGLIASIVLSLVPTLSRGADLAIEFLRPMPPIALLPIALLVSGFGYRMEIQVIAFSTIWPVLVISRHSIEHVEPELIDVSRALDLSAFRKVISIILPTALRGCFVAFRLAASIALVVAITVEITNNPQGLGYDLMVAQQSLHPALMCAILVWIGCLGWAVNRIFVEIERRAFSWDGNLA